MGFVPQFEHDIFISYRRASNDARDKWVDAFCEQLESRLEEIVGDIKIWRDTAQIAGGDQWRPEIAQALNNAAIFLAIISRTYFDSDECRSELDQFLGRLKERSGSAERKIIPIFKQPPRPDQILPQELAQIDHIKFFDQDPDAPNRFKEFTPGIDGEFARRFWETLERLSQDLMGFLEQLKHQAQQRVVGTVYLARVGPELHAERAKLRADLQQRGYAVVPEAEYLWNSSDFNEKIAADLDQAQLCIHQVSRTASSDAKTSDRARLQLAHAAHAMKSRARKAPLVWIQPAPDTDKEARGLIDYIERDLANDGVEYSQGSLEDFKTQIYERLRQRTPERPAAVAATAREIALIVEDSDLAAIGDVRTLLTNTFTVDATKIKFTGTSPHDAAALARTLERCGRCIIFWGSQPEEWVCEILANGALAPYAAKETLCVYCAPPASTDKTMFRTSRASVIDGLSPAEGPLRQFLSSGEGRR